MVMDSLDSFLLGLKLNNTSIRALLDSGATHCFIDSALVSDLRLPASLLPRPMRLRLFDGSYAPEDILYEVTVPIQFASATILPVSFLVTPLDPNISAVIGLRWLRQYNPLVDWANNRIEFRTPQTKEPCPDSGPLPDTSGQPCRASPALTPSVTPQVIPTIQAISAAPAISAPPIAPVAPEATLRSAQAISISFVNAAAFRMLTRTNNVQTGILRVQPSSPDAFLRGARPDASPDSPDIEEIETLRSQIPAEYHDFLDVFSKSKADKLPDHNPQFDHSIKIEDGKQPPFGPIYNMSETEAEALRDFLKENLNRGFIRQSQSSCGAPVLFVKKKDGSLCLCVDWGGLNAITKKDRYPLPLIPNLLDRLRGS